MRKVFLFTLILALITLVIVSYFYVTERVYPHTYLGKKQISFMRRQEVLNLLSSYYHESFYIKVRNRVYPMQYKNMGIMLDKDATARVIFENNTLSFPHNIISFFASLSSQKMALPGLIFTQDFATYVEKAQFDFTKNPDVVTVDNTQKMLSLQDNEDRYQMDLAHLTSLILFHFGEKDATVEPHLVQIIKTDKRERIITENKKLEDIFSRPVDIIIQDEGRLLKTSITPDELKRIFDVSYPNGETVFTPHEDILSFLIDAKVDPLLTRNKKVDLKTLKADVLSSFAARVKGSPGGPLVANTVLSPIREVEATNTHGEVASRYIEVSISKQKMYIFDQGTMIKSYPISTGLYFPTPKGSFKIMNKALEGYSDIYNVYMPYWMAFYYGWAGGQDAYFGIHELPYWYVDGERKQRPREFLGSPHTGGCVSLDIGAAKEVYDFSFVGMDVVVYE